MNWWTILIIMLLSPTVIGTIIATWGIKKNRKKAGK
jgi:hypothetical protein